jgi:SAM-dependent methyltransferase
MNLDLYADTFDTLLNYLPSNATVLELGCGPGNVVKYLREKRSDLDIMGVDLAPEMIKEATKQNPDVKFVVMDIVLADQIQQQFNAVIAAFCLPYISYNDAAIAFNSIEQLTDNNGILYLSCMEGPKERSGWEKTSFTGDDEMYINYYERTEIENWLTEHHFTVNEFFTKDYPEEDGSITTDLIYIASKSQRH